MYETYRWEFTPDEIRLVIRRLKHSAYQTAADRDLPPEIAPELQAELMQPDPENEEWDAAMDLLAQTEGPMLAAWETKNWEVAREVDIKRNQALLALLRIVMRNLERGIGASSDHDD